MTDGNGLQLRITEKNKRTWSVQYRHNGRMLKMSFGTWPSISCIKARKIADRIRYQLAQGVDPQTEKRKAKAKKLSVEEAWSEFDSRHIEINNKPKTQKEYRRNAQKDILPKLGKLVLVDVTKSDIISLLKAVSKDALTMANRTQALLHKFFNWCLSMGYIEVNPVTGIPKAKKEKKVPGPPKGPPPPLLEEGEDASEDEDEEKYTDIVVPPPVRPPPGWMPPAPSGSPPPSDEEEEEEENVEEIVIDGIVVPPPPPDDTDEDDDEEEDEEKVVENVETTAPPPPPPPVGIDIARTINKPPMFGNTLEMKAQSHMASISRPPPPSHQPMRAANIYQRPPPIHSMNNARGNNPPQQHFFSPAAPMAVKKKSQEQATIRGEATTIAAPSQNPALQKLVPAHLRVQRGGDQNRKKKVNPAPTVVKVSKEKKDEKGKDDQYLNFLVDVATLGAFQE